MLSTAQGHLAGGFLAILAGGATRYGFLRSLAVRALPHLHSTRKDLVAQGRVLHIGVHHVQGDGGLTHDVDIRTAETQFRTADGEQVRYAQLLETGPTCRRGDLVTVHYDPVDPSSPPTIQGACDLTTAQIVKTRFALLGGAITTLGVYLLLTATLG